jgi:hypothetical protein
VEHLSKIEFTKSKKEFRYEEFKEASMLSLVKNKEDLKRLSLGGENQYEI